MKYEILKLLAENARYTNEEIATMINCEEKEVAKETKDYF